MTEAQSHRPEPDASRRARLSGRAVSAARWAHATPERAVWTWFGLLALLGTLVYSALAWTPTSYARALDLMGAPVEQQGVVFGEPRPVRSDEWAVYTPFVQIAVRNDLGQVNALSPYHESLISFFALPLADAAMIFRPQMWGFLVLPPAYAYALHWCVLTVAFVLGFALLIRSFGAPAWLSLATALLLFFSNFTQVWWTTTGGVLALAPWPFLALMAPVRPWVRGLLSFYAGAAWLLACLYPPYLIGAAFALGVALIALRPDRLRPIVLIPAAIGSAAALGVCALYFWDLIQSMRHTAHPGVRNFGGGLVDPLQVLSSLFPYVHARGFTPMPGTQPNEVEVATIGSFLPLIALVFTDHRLLADALKRNWITAAVLAAAIAMLVVWMLFPVPPWVGLPLLWNQVPAYRFTWPLGLAVTIAAAWLVCLAPFRFGPIRLGAFLALAGGAWWLSKGGAMRESWFDGVILAAILAAAAVALVRRDWWKPAAVCAALVTSMATFGLYNPVQSAKVIFNPPETPLMTQYRRVAALHPQGWSVHRSGIGAIWAGVGIPSIAHTMLRPQMDFFRQVFPDMPEAEFDFLFNRYEHVVLSLEDEPVLVSSNQIRLPYRRFAAPIPLTREPGPAPQAPLLETEEAVWALDMLADGRWRARAFGWLPDFDPERRREFSIYLEQPDSVSVDLMWSAYRPSQNARLQNSDGAPGYMIILEGSGDPDAALAMAESAMVLVRREGDPVTRLPLLTPLKTGIETDIAAALTAPEGGATDRMVYDPAARTLTIHGWRPRAAGGADTIIAVTDIAADNAAIVPSARPDVQRAGLADQLYSGFRIQLTGVDPATVTADSRLCVLALQDGAPVMRILDGRSPECRIGVWVQ